MDCYKCITETLDFLLSTSLSHPQSPSVPSSPGPPPAPDPNRLTNREAQIYVSVAQLSETKDHSYLIYMLLLTKYCWFVDHTRVQEALYKVAFQISFSLFGAILDLLVSTYGILLFLQYAYCQKGS